MFQSLKRDHSSSDDDTRLADDQAPLVSIAQARPFLFRRRCLVSLAMCQAAVSIAQARPFLFRRRHARSFCGAAGCFNRSSATIPLPTTPRPVQTAGLAHVSIAQARPFLFRRLSAASGEPVVSPFQSLKRDHSSSDRFLQKGFSKCHELVSIAQARPFLFRRWPRLPVPPPSRCFNRSSATIPLPTPRAILRIHKKCRCFNRSSATIPLPTGWAGRTTDG